MILPTLEEAKNLTETEALLILLQIGQEQINKKQYKTAEEVFEAIK